MWSLKLSVVSTAPDGLPRPLEALERLRGGLPAAVEAIELLQVVAGERTPTVAEPDDFGAKGGASVRVVTSPSAGLGDLFRSGVAAAESDFLLFLGPRTSCGLAELADLLGPLLDGRADLAVGAEAPGGGPEAGAQLRARELQTWLLAFRTSLIQSVPVRSKGEALAVELAKKLAKRRFRAVRVRLSDACAPRRPRRRSLSAFLHGAGAALRYWAVDDLFGDDQYGAEILVSLERATRFNRWMAETVAPHVGRRVLEIGAGIGNITTALLPREAYCASDVNPAYLHYLENLGFGSANLSVREVDADEPADFERLAGEFDTVVCLNVLEHVRDPLVALANMRRALQPGGRLVLYVPQHPWLFSSLDRALEHRCRYTPALLRRELAASGFEVQSIEPFNRMGTVGWFLNGRLLARPAFGRFQLKAFDSLVPVLRRVDRILPIPGLGLIAVARRAADEPARVRQ